MSRARTAALLKAILTGQAGLSGVSDADLLRRFSNDNDQAAFAGLLRRHRGMVLGVCRRSLPNLQDAEDACQATFLILARKARSHNRWQASVANWLYATARKVSRNARVAAQRRARREARAAVPEAVQPVDTMSGRELLAALDEELERLPAALPCGSGSVLSGRADAGGSRRPAGRACRDDQDPSRAWPETPGRCLDRPWLCPGSGALDASRHVLGAGVGGTVAGKCLNRGRRLSPRCRRRSCQEGCRASCNAKVDDRARGQPVGQCHGSGFMVFNAGGGNRARQSGHAGKERYPASRCRAAGARADDECLRSGPGSAGPAVRRGQAHAGWQGTAAREPRHVGPRWPVHGQDSQGDGGANAFPRSVRSRGRYRLRRYRHTQPGAALELRLVKDNTIHGKIVDTQGKPVAGVQVAVTTVGAFDGKSVDRFLSAWTNRMYSFKWPDADRNLWQGGGAIVPATTDAEGRFSLAGTGAERLVHLHTSGAGSAAADWRVVNRPGFNPTPYNETARKQSPIIVSGSGHPPVPVLHGPEPVFVVDPGKVIRGVVRDADTGKPWPGVEVHCRGTADGFPATTDAAGSYEIRGVPKDNFYWLWVCADLSAGLPENRSGSPTPMTILPSRPTSP